MYQTAFSDDLLTHSSIKVLNEHRITGWVVPVAQRQD